MRRLRSFIPTILICLGIALSIVFAAMWHRTLTMQESVQYITGGGTAYSVGTGPGALTFCSATRYPELVRGYHADWIWYISSGWSHQMFTYGVPYTPPTPATQPAGSARPKPQYIRPAPWNHRAIGFESGSRNVPLPNGEPGAASHSTFLTIPLWFLMLLTAAPSIIWVRFRLRE